MDQKTKYCELTLNLSIDSTLYKSKTQICFLIDKLILKYAMKCKRSIIVKIILKKNEVRSPTLP